MIVTADYVKSCICDYKIIVAQQKRSRMNLVQQLIDLKDEEEALIMPGKSAEPNSFGFSSNRTFSDETYNRVSSLSRANIRGRVKSIQDKLEQLQENAEIVERTLYVFNSMSLYYPLHVSVVNDYLYEKNYTNLSQLEARYKMHHNTLSKMITALCQAIAELVSKGNYEVTENIMNESLSKETIGQLKKYEYRRKDK